jgi:uroporphyrinogen decarboxylase
MLLALRHKEADRIPTGENQVYGALASKIAGYPTLYSTGWEELQALWNGKREEVVRDYGRTLVDLARKLEWDYVRVPFVPPRREYKMPKMTGPYSWIDEEGNEIHFNPEAGKIVHPEFLRDLAADDLPDPDNDPFTVDDSQLDALRYVVKELKDTHFIIGRPPYDGTFPWDQTVGMEEFLVRMLTDDEFVKRAVDVYVGRNIKMLEAFIDAGADAVMTTDDYSDNRGPIMGAETFRKFIAPGIKRQVEAVHKKGGYFIKHTDGNTWSILDDIVAAGIDGWHGIQINIGMDMAKLKEKYGDKLCFFGGTNCDTLIDGGKDDIRKEVLDTIRGAAKGGGLVITTSNVVPPGATLENYTAMREAIREYGKYPLSLPCRERGKFLS